MTVAADAGAGTVRHVLSAARTNHGDSLLALSHARPQLIVFLRHAGCPFCREAATDIRRQQDAIERRRLGIVLVHMMTEAQAAPFFDRYGLGDLPRVSDPDRALYHTFELKPGSLWQIGGPKVWWRTVQAIATGHLIGRRVGDAFQMPGVFVIHDGAVIASFRHRTQADRPDYEAIACRIDQ